MTTHLVIPDTQVKEGVPTDHLGWIGRYAVDRKPDTIIHLGDHWDMPSLSSWDRGKVQFEGRRYKTDIEAGNRGFAELCRPIEKHLWSARNRGADLWTPRLVFLRGNHEYRLQRTVESDSVLEGFMSYDDMNTRGWEVHDFLKPVCIDGIYYAHYFSNPMTGKPLGGMVSTRLKNLGHSFTMGHQQVLDHAMRFVAGRAQRGLVVGSCYLHEEIYKGYQGSAHWRGVIVCHEVRDGSYDLMEVSLDFLCRKYEGMPLDEFMALRHPDVAREFWAA